MLDVSWAFSGVSVAAGRSQRCIHLIRSTIFPATHFSARIRSGTDDCPACFVPSPAKNICGCNRQFRRIIPANRRLKRHVPVDHEPVSFIRT
jgi:hypothetical protein